jgi:hypothetical protein
MLKPLLVLTAPVAVLLAASSMASGAEAAASRTPAPTLVAMLGPSAAVPRDSSERHTPSAPGATT